MLIGSQEILLRYVAQTVGSPGTNRNGQDRFLCTLKWSFACIDIINMAIRNSSLYEQRAYRPFITFLSQLRYRQLHDAFFQKTSCTGKELKFLGMRLVESRSISNKTKDHYEMW